MRKLLLAILLFSAINSYAQTLPNFDEIRLDQATDYKNADNHVLTAATYLFSTPLEKNNIDRLKSLQFIIKWMTGTPDYTFTIDKVATDVTKGNDDLVGLYMAGMAKYCIE